MLIMKDNIVLSDDTTIDESSVEPTIPAEMKITSWNVSVVTNIPYFIRIKKTIFYNSTINFWKKSRQWLTEKSALCLHNILRQFMPNNTLIISVTKLEVRTFAIYLARGQNELVTVISKGSSDEMFDMV